MIFSIQFNWCQRKKSNDDVREDTDKDSISSVIVFLKCLFKPPKECYYYFSSTVFETIQHELKSREHWSFP